MKKSLLISLLLLVFGLPSAKATEINYGELKLDTLYEFKEFCDIKGIYVAPVDEVITVSSTTTDFVTPFKKTDYSEAYSFDYIRDGLGNYYELKLAEGDTVYFYKRFAMDNGEFKLTKNVDITLSATTTPAAGSSFTPSGMAQIAFNFNRPVKYSGAEIQYGTTVSSIAAFESGSTIFFNLKKDVYALMKSGALKEGDAFTLRLKGVRLASNSDMIYGTDGTFEATFIAGARPVAVKSTLAPETFFSYWQKGDNDATFRLTFDGKIRRDDKAYARLSYGMNEGSESELYLEELPVAFTDTTITVDFSGVRRRAVDMLPSGTAYKQMELKISSLTDTLGNYIYTEVSGTIGTLGFSFPFEEVKVNFTPDYTPADESSIQCADELEIWTDDFAKFSPTTVRFSFDKADGTRDSIDVVGAENLRRVIDEDFEGAGSLFVTIPREVCGATNIEVSLPDFIAADGVDHSADFGASYDIVRDGINDVLSTTNAAATIYTLDGRRVNAVKKGVYVVNGKKLLKF